MVNQAVYEALRQVARTGTVTHYSDIASLVGVNLNTGRGRKEIGCVLAEVCRSEAQQGHPLLGSVVVRKDSQMPGKGYFRGAQNLGKFHGGSDKDKRAFWLQELKRVHDYWAAH